MISHIIKKREIRRRETILRGVFEDNLRIVGRLRSSHFDKRPFYLKNPFLTVSALFVFLFLLGHNLTPSLFSDEEITASTLTYKTPVRAAADSAGSVDYMSFLGNPDIPLSRMFGLGVRTIMIDPGHGGTDPGTSGKMGTQEKDMTLDIARRLKRRLGQYGVFNVLMTREQDTTLSLNERVELARMTKTDLFISIHLNYLPFKPINIIETYYFGPPSDDKTVKLVEKENAGSQYGLSDFKEIIEKIGDTLKLQESRELATSIQRSLFSNSSKNNSNIYDFGVKRAPFVVLLGVDVPAVLAEVSCLSNRKEERKLNTVKHRENIAHYLEAGILDYLHKSELTKGELMYEAKKHQERG